MIERLDSHDRANFSSVFGQLPYQSKRSYPCAVVKTADTVNTVLSDGLTTYWYNGLISPNQKYRGTIPGGIVKLYYPIGIPDFITESEYTDGWYVQLKGHFKALYSGDYEFYFGGEGRLDYFAVGTDGASSLFTSDLSLGATELQAAGAAATMTANTWYAIDMTYQYSGELGNQSGFTVLYQVDSASQMPDKIILSAGVTAPEGAAPSNMQYSLSTVTQVSDVKLNIRANGADTLTFHVPFVSSASNYTFDGYYKKHDNSYEDSAIGLELKKWRMITFSEGYCTAANSAAYQTVDKFAGQIRDFDIVYSEDGNDKIKVTCYSYEAWLKDTFNLDAPNVMDYITNEYMTELAGHVNGQTKPQAYDGWEVYKVYRNLLINAYIDPLLFYKREKRNNLDNNSAIGAWYVDYVGKTDLLYLSNEQLYGRPTVLEGEQVDDKYNYAIDTGEYVQDAINSVLEPYGFMWGLNRYGYPYMKSIDVPDTVIHSTTWASGERQFTKGSGVTLTKDFDAVKACWVSTSVASQTVATVDGVQCQRIDLIAHVSPRGGVDDDAESLVYTIASASGTVKTSTVNLYHATAWSYYGGVDPETGVNPCVFNLATNLPYDYYKVTLTSDTINGECGVDSIFAYDRDIDTPVFYFKTSDNVAPGHVVTLEVKDTVKDVRNDCIVLGRRTGTKTGVTSDNERAEINPNNPTYTFRQSRTKDLTSIHSVSAINYVGRPLQTIIVDLAIASEDQADYISYNFIQNHRLATKDVIFQTLGNPLIERGDCVSIDEEFKDGLTSTKKLWVSEVSSEYTDKYVTKFKAIDKKPYPSYWTKPEPDLELFDNNPFQNIRVYNGGNVSTVETNINAAAITLKVDGSLEYSPSRGYIMVGGYPYNYEIMKYSSVSSAGGTWYYDGMIRGLQRTAAASWTTLSTVNGAYDPYTGDSMGITPKVTFNLVKSGYLQVQMWAVDDTIDAGLAQKINGVPIQLTTLTERTNEEWPVYGREYIVWGKDRYFTWNGNDDLGTWNSYIHTYNNNNSGLINWVDTMYSVPTFSIGVGTAWITNLSMRIINSSIRREYIDNIGKIEGGIYTIENKDNGYVKIFPLLDLSIGNKSYSTPDFGLDSTADMSYMYLRRGCVSTVTFEIDYSSVYWSNLEGSGGVIIPGDFDLGDYTLPEMIDNSGATLKPFKNARPVFIATHKNDGGSYVSYSITDETASEQSDKGDNFYGNRPCMLQLDANINRGSFGVNNICEYPQTGAAVDLNTITIIDDEEYHRIFYDVNTDSGVNGKFNPKHYPTDLSFLNVEVYNSANYQPGFYWNTIFFSGQIRDKSGRICIQTSFDNAGNSPSDPPMWGYQHSDWSFYEAEGLYEKPDNAKVEAQLRGNFIGWFDYPLARGHYPFLGESVWFRCIEHLDHMIWSRKSVDMNYPFEERNFVGVYIPE